MSPSLRQAAPWWPRMLRWGLLWLSSSITETQSSLPPQPSSPRHRHRRWGIRLRESPSSKPMALLLNYFTSLTMKLPSTTSKPGFSPLQDVNVCSPGEKLARLLVLGRLRLEPPEAGDRAASFFHARLPGGLLLDGTANCIRVALDHRYFYQRATLHRALQHELLACSPKFATISSSPKCA